MNFFYYVMSCKFILVGSGTYAIAVVNNHIRVERMFVIPWLAKVLWVASTVMAHWGCWGYNFWQGHNLCFCLAEFGFNRLIGEAYLFSSPIAYSWSMLCLVPCILLHPNMCCSFPHFSSSIHLLLGEIWQPLLLPDIKGKKRFLT